MMRRHRIFIERTYLCETHCLVIDENPGRRQRRKTAGLSWINFVIFKAAKLKLVRKRAAGVQCDANNALAVDKGN
jgi:hypothetical protein